MVFLMPLALFHVPSVKAQTDPPASTSTSTSTSRNTPEATAFDVVVQTPPQFTELRELIENHLELQRYRSVFDLDDVEFSRLMVLAESDARNLAGTLGYFSPEISIARQAGAAQRPVIVITIEPGQPTVIGPVALNFAGDIAESKDLDAQVQRADIQRNWQLPTGQIFTQEKWNAAKTQALRALVAHRYPAGKLADSVANVNADNKIASLGVDLDSGPVFRLGRIDVTGMARYSPVLVPRLSQLKKGAVYDQKQLTDAQQRLTSSGYFDSAYIFIDPEGDPGAVPVQVQVREAKLQKVVLGVGVSTDSGPRVSLAHTHNSVPGTDWRAVTTLQLDKKTPFAQTEWTSLPDEANWRWVGLARADQINDNSLSTRNQRLRFGRSQTRDHIDRNIYVQYDRSRVSSPDLLTNTVATTGDGSAVSGNYVWTGRYFDSLPFPRKGYGLGFELGGGYTLSTGPNAKRQPYLRGVGRWLGIYSLERGRIALRAEAGAVQANDAARVPSTALFRTGGDSTVRGYGYRDIGITLPGGIVGPGRYMAVSSIEWQRPIRRNNLPTEWENTVFLDVGGVADKLNEIRPAVGVGTGVRWKSPIGPLQIDLAYGVKIKQLRLHTSVGFVF